MLYNDYGADKDHKPQERVSGEFKSSRQALALCGIKSKRAHFPHMLYLAHQLWTLIPWGDHSQPSSSSNEMQFQEQLPSDLLAGLCITHPVTSPETGPLPAGRCSVWSSSRAGDETGCLLGEAAGWRPSDREDDAAQTKHTRSA